MYYGLDVHKDTIAVAIAVGVRAGEARFFGAPRPEASRITCTRQGNSGSFLSAKRKATASSRSGSSSEQVINVAGRPSSSVARAGAASGATDPDAPPA